MNNNYAEYVNISIDDDEMSADIFLVDPPSYDFYNIEELEDFIKKEGIVFGVDRQVLENAINQKRYGEFIQFARGQRPSEAVNGYYNFMFNTNPSAKPKLNPDGSVDYYNLNLVEVVKKDELIAEYVPKKDGSEGRTVMGGFIPGKRALELAPLRGKGFYVSEDKRQYYAEYDGKVELVMGHVTVSAIHTIYGDVDLSTGHIDFRGDLLITGDVKSDMQVKATGNITVEGSVEAAYVEAGKAVLIKGGILGGGQAIIKGGGNVFAQFIENAAVESNACIQADSIVNSKINAYSDINVFGKTSCIIGGTCKANRYIKTKVIGSKHGIATVVEVGVSSDSYAERKRYADQLLEMNTELSKVEKQLDQLLRKSEEKTEIFIQTTRRKIELSADVYRIQAIVKELDKRLTIGKNAEIVAEDKVYPGTKLLIDGIRYDVADEFENIMFFRKMEKIISKRYEDSDKDMLYNA